MKILKNGLLAACGVAATFGASQAYASGFALRENSAVNSGEADAGAVSGVADISTVYNNPAGMTYFDGLQFENTATLIDPSGKLSNVQGTNIYGTSLTGGAGRDPTEAKVIPAGFMLWAPSQDWRLGLGITVPFGLITSYSGTSAVRYQTLLSEVEALDINPAVAYRVNDWLSLGGGVTMEKVKVKLTNGLDLGGILGSELGPAFGSALSQTEDGRSDVYGTSWGFGYNLGVMLQPVSDTRIGVSYRSGIDQDVRGREDYTVPTPIQTLLNLTGKGQLLADGGAGGELDLPGNVWVGLSHEFTDRFGMDVSYQWTNWSRFKQITIDFDNPAQTPATMTEKYQDTSFAAIGGHYKVNDDLTVRAGFAYDQTPTVTEYRDFRLPDADRYWLAAGASYNITQNIQLSASYTHLFFSNSTINHVDQLAINDTVSATSSASADLVAVSIGFKF